MTDPEQIRPLELLHRTAETIGAVICITATSDRRTPGGGRRLFTRRIGAQLSKLVVVIPLRPVEVEVPKWLRLARGTVVAQADLVEEVPLDDVALVVAEQLACRIAALRRPSPRCRVTCVVGVRTTRGVLLAGDQQMSWENGKRMSRDAKTIPLSEILAVAYCGSGRLGQILQHHLDGLDDPPLGRDDQRWVVKHFVPYLRDVLATTGHLVVSLADNVEGLGYSAFLLAVRGRLFMVEDDFSVAEHRYAFDALGSGMETAIGAMHTAAGKATYAPLTFARAVKVAQAGVVAAAEYTNFVGGDITTVETAAFTADERRFARTIARRA